MPQIIFCILAGIWLIATGLVYKTAVKKEYDTYGVADWDKK